MNITLTDAATGKEVIRYPALHRPSQWTIDTLRSQYGLVVTVEQVSA